ncbi:cupin domain-containing protein [Bacillus shivajii]|uniref:cupin domain-containing protein n=1 Tax=Bacillus shivajii TaxID=1983719 RepID=UPI001CFA0917|nr:cupin domain-containing protein [Bacillus shivajii]UCZ51761.1 cupin domain-containing protein [Bacillus shivajii]
MYYYPNNMYSYPYYSNHSQMYPRNDMYRNQQENNRQEYKAILDGIKKEASALDLYQRLAQVSPDEENRNDLLHAIENKKLNLHQFTNLYFSLTGTQPVYQIDQISFDSYRDGLKKAHEAVLKACEEYRKHGLSSQNPAIQNVFFYASSGETENATRFEILNNQAVQDAGPNPYVVNIEEATKQNNTFRSALWTGEYLQLTLMSIEPGDDIGLEIHPDHDQFIRIEQGQGLVQMGDSRDNLTFEESAYDDYAIFVPAGKWHNLTNTGNTPLKLYSIYAPPEHPFGTVHETKEIAMAAEGHDH